MHSDLITEAAMYLADIDAHDVACTAAQTSFVRGCRGRLAAGKLNGDDVRRLEDVVADLDYRAEYGNGAEIGDYGDLWDFRLRAGRRQRNG